MLLTLYVEFSFVILFYSILLTVSSDMKILNDVFTQTNFAETKLQL